MALSPGAARQLFTSPSKPGAGREAAQVCPPHGAQPLVLASHCTEASVLQLVTPNQTQDILHRLTTMATKVLLCCKTNFEQNFYTLLPFQVVTALEYQKGRKAVRKEEPLCDGQRALQ